MVTVSAPGRPRIVVTEPIAEAGLTILRRAGDVHIAHQTTRAGLRGALACADALVVRSSPVTASLLDLAPRLRVIGRHGAGLDNIDLDAARARGITVVNTPGANARSVAEFVMLAALALGRQLVTARQHLVDGALHDHGSLPGAVVASGLEGRMVQGRVFGVIGLGAIGARVAELATAFGAEVLATDPALRAAPPGVRLTDIDTVIRSSDLLSLHVPLTPATTRLIDAAAIAAMPPRSLLVNTSRSGVVDDQAVIAALDSGHLGGYAVDVYDPEPPDRADPLLHHPRVLATPHMAAMTVDALAQMARMVAEGVAAALAGDIPPPLVTKE